MEAIISAIAILVNEISAKRVAVLLAIWKSRRTVFESPPILMSTKWYLIPFVAFFLDNLLLLLKLIL